MKRLLVTGASGFLGSRIIEYYRDRYEICAPSHTDMDITDKEKVAAVFRDFKPHMVVHSAAISDVGVCERESFPHNISTQALACPGTTEAESLKVCCLGTA